MVFFSGMAKTKSPHKTPVVGSYIFGAGCYIFFSTIFELLGIQAVTTKGHSIALPAPIADINGAIAMGITSYAFILIAGAVCNGAKGVLGVLKDFSLPISMSVRLFGALLSGLLGTALVYDYVALSFVLVDNTTSTKAIASAAIVGVVATAGAIGMAISIAKTAESMARQPEAAGKINSAMMLGLVFIETAIIYALIIAILIIFVL